MSLVCLANCVFHEFYIRLRTLLWRINDDDDDDDDDDYRAFANQAGLRQ